MINTREVSGKPGQAPNVLECSCGQDWIVPKTRKASPETYRLLVLRDFSPAGIRKQFTTQKKSGKALYAI